MIFIGLFLLIVIIVMSLNIHNHSNLDKIEDYLKTKNCPTYLYSKGSYKAICEDDFLEIKNSFTVDIDKNSKIVRYKEIANLKTKDLKIIINENYILEFSEKNDLELFYAELEEKLNK